MELTRNILKQMIAEEMANEKDLEANIRKAHKEEGGAAGIDALEKHTKASAKDIKAAVKDMDDVGQHKDGDYIQGDGKEIQIAKEQMNEGQKDMTCEEVKAKYAMYKKEHEEAEQMSAANIDSMEGFLAAQYYLEMKKLKEGRPECFMSDKDRKDRESGDFSQLYKESKKDMLKRIVAEELAKMEIETIMKEKEGEG